MSSYFAFIRFCDKDKTPWVLKSDEIQNFNPSHSSDFEKDRTYNIKWQENSDSFDGSFMGKILCMAASLVELKEACKAKNIKRMPPSFRTLLTKQSSEVKDVTQALSTVDTPSPSPSKKQLRIDSAEAKKLRIQSILQELDRKVESQNSIQEEEKSSDVSSSVDNLKVSNDADSVGSREHRVETVELIETVDNVMGEDTKKAAEDERDKLDVPKERKGRKEKEVKNNEDDEEEDDDDDDGEDHDDNSDSENSSESDSDSNSSSGDFSDSSVEADNELAALNEKLSKLQTCYNVSETQRLKYFSENVELKDEISKLKEELLKTKEKLQKEHEFSERYRKIKEENRKLKELISSVQTQLASGQTPARRSLFDSDNTTEDSFMSESSPFKRYKPEDAEKPKVKKVVTTSCSASNSSDKKKQGLTEEEKVDIAERVRKDILGEKLMQPNEQGKIDIGGGIVISKEKWTKAIKSQSKNTLFIKKLGTCVYGSEGLKKRTEGSPKTGQKGKKAATPRKVDAFAACLRGKLLAQDPNFPQVEKASEAAKSILGAKMQDEARERTTLKTDKKSKSEPKLKPKDKKKKKKKKKKDDKKQSNSN